MVWIAPAAGLTAASLHAMTVREAAMRAQQLSKRLTVASAAGCEESGSSSPTH